MEKKGKAKNQFIKLSNRKLTKEVLIEKSSNNGEQILPKNGLLLTDNSDDQIINLINEMGPEKPK